MKTKDQLAHFTNEQLKERILERLNHIKRIYEFAESIIKENGMIVQRSVNSCNTHVVARLDNFSGFRFTLDTGQTMMGGNDLDVEFHSKIVLSVYYQTNLDECQVNIFDESVDWQTELEYVLGHKDEIISQIEKAEGEKRERLLSDSEHSNKRMKLSEAAERLKL